MILKLNVNDGKNAFRGTAKMRLDFGLKQWSVEDTHNPAWSGVGLTRKGFFEMKDWGVIWLWDQQPGRKQKQNTVIIWDAPHGEKDPTRSAGKARIYEPKDPKFKDGTIVWKIDDPSDGSAATETKNGDLAPIRQRALDLCKAILPPVGQFLKPGTKDMMKISTDSKDSALVQAEYAKGHKYTNCGSFPAYIAKQLGGKGLITYMLSAGMKPFAQRPNVNAWVGYNGKNRPQPGDFYILEHSKDKFSHIGVIIDASTDNWRTADAGQADGFSAGYRDRKFKDGTLTGEPTQGGGFGYLAGWVNIENKNLFPNW